MKYTSLYKLLDRATCQAVHNTQKSEAYTRVMSDCQQSDVYPAVHTAVPSNHQSSHKWRGELQFSQYADKKIIVMIYIQQQIYALI